MPVFKTITDGNKHCSIELSFQ